MNNQVENVNEAKDSNLVNTKAHETGIEDVIELSVRCVKQVLKAERSMSKTHGDRGTKKQRLMLMIATLELLLRVHGISQKHRVAIEKEIFELTSSESLTVAADMLKSYRYQLEKCKADEVNREEKVEKLVFKCKDKYNPIADEMICIETEGAIEETIRKDYTQKLNVGGVYGISDDVFQKLHFLIGAEPFYINEKPYIKACYEIGRAHV